LSAKTRITKYAITCAFEYRCSLIGSLSKRRNDDHYSSVYDEAAARRATSMITTKAKLDVLDLQGAEETVSLGTWVVPIE